MIWVPRPSVLPRGSFVIVKSPAADDSQMYWSSSLCLEMTVTLSATRNAE